MLSILKVLENPEYEYLIVPYDWTPPIQPLPPSVGPFDPAQKCKISLRSSHGRYLQMSRIRYVDGGTEGFSKANELHCKPSTKLTCSPLGDGKVVVNSSIASEPKWLSVYCQDIEHPGDTSAGHNPEDVLKVDAKFERNSEERTESTTDRAVFEVIHGPDNTIGLKSKYNTFISADGNHNLSWNKSEFGVNERWNVVVHRYLKDGKPSPKIVQTKTVELVVNTENASSGVQVCDYFIYLNIITFRTFSRG